MILIPELKEWRRGFQWLNWNCLQLVMGIVLVTKETAIIDHYKAYQRMNSVGDIFEQTEICRYVLLVWCVISLSVIQSSWTVKQSDHTSALLCRPGVGGWGGATSLFKGSFTSAKLSLQLLLRQECVNGQQIWRNSKQCDFCWLQFLLRHMLTKK